MVSWRGDAHDDWARRGAPETRSTGEYTARLKQKGGATLRSNRRAFIACVTVVSLGRGERETRKKEGALAEFTG